MTAAHPILSAWSHMSNCSRCVTFSDAVEFVRITETVAQTWPRLAGERPDDAHAWVEHGFTDEQVVAWLEVGVHTARAAAGLRAAKLEPRDVAAEHTGGLALGLAFSRHELTLAEVQRAVLGGEVEA